MNERNEDKHAARRVKRGGRIVILPPLGHGDVWAGAAGRIRPTEPMQREEGD